MQQISNVSKETEDKSVYISLGNSKDYFTKLRLNLGEALVTFLIMGLQYYKNTLYCDEIGIVNKKCPKPKIT